MTKVNRREYLKGLGAAGALAMSGIGLIASTGAPSREDIGRKEDPVAPSQPRGRANSILRWPITTTLPSPTPFVAAVFQGLMGFCYNDTDQCEIRFHPGAGQHELRIRIYEVDYSTTPPKCTEITIDPPLPSPTTKINAIELEVKGSSGTPVKFFQRDEEFFDRLQGDPKDARWMKDFRWLPDLDGGYFYPENLGKKKVSGGRLRVLNGTFHTRVRTNSTFMIVDRGNFDLEYQPYGHVAMVMGAAIAATGTDVVQLTVNGTPLKNPMRADSGKNYQIVFSSMCMTACPAPQVNDQDETKRNDFHFNRKVLRIPLGKREYALRLQTEAVTPAQNDFCPFDVVAVNTDEAPCMGAGYGQTNGFP